MDKFEETIVCGEVNELSMFFRATFPVNETEPLETAKSANGKLATPVKEAVANRLVMVVVVPETETCCEPESPVIVMLPPVPFTLFTTDPPPTMLSTYVFTADCVGINTLLFVAMVPVVTPAPTQMEFPV